MGQIYSRELYYLFGFKKPADQLLENRMVFQQIRIMNKSYLICKTNGLTLNCSYLIVNIISFGIQSD